MHSSQDDFETNNKILYASKYLVHLTDEPIYLVWFHSQRKNSYSTGHVYAQLFHQLTGTNSLDFVYSQYEILSLLHHLQYSEKFHLGGMTPNYMKPTHNSMDCHLKSKLFIWKFLHKCILTV
jgi:hypothetical protein